MLTHHEIVGLLLIWLICGYIGFVFWLFEAWINDFAHKIKIRDWVFIFLIMVTFGLAGLLMSFRSLKNYIE